MSWFIFPDEPLKYANSGVFPATLPDGTVVEDVSTHTLYVFNAGTSTYSLLTSGSGGINKEVQYNDSGALNGDSNFTFNKTTGMLFIKQITIKAGQAIYLDG